MPSCHSEYLLIRQKQKVNKRNCQRPEYSMLVRAFQGRRWAVRVHVNEYGRRCRLRCASGVDWAVPGEDGFFPAFDILNWDTRDVACLQSPLYKLISCGEPLEWCNAIGQSKPRRNRWAGTCLYVIPATEILILSRWLLWRLALPKHAQPIFVGCCVRTVL